MNTGKRITWSFLLGASAFAVALPSARATTTPDPGDYTPLPAGTDLAMIYLQRQYANNLYAHGKKSNGKLGLGLDLSILRNVNYFKIGDLPADWQLILPMARQHTSLTDTRVTGVGDLTAGGTVWTVSHPDKAEYLGWSAFLTMPTGAKNEQGLSVSNNRYALDLQSGYTRSLGGPWTLDLVGQVELYTKDRTSKMKNTPLYRLFTSLRYALTPKTSLEFVARQSWALAREKRVTSSKAPKMTPICCLASPALSPLASRYRSSSPMMYMLKMGLASAAYRPVFYMCSDVSSLKNCHQKRAR